MRSASNHRGAAVRQPRSATAALLRQLAMYKGQLALDHDRLILIGDVPDELQQRIRQHQAELVHELRPKVTAEEAARVRSYLDGAGISVVYVTDVAAACQAADELLREAVESGVIGIDIETAVRAEHQRPLPIAITKYGRKARRQPKEGDAGLALDPYRARIRLLQAFAGGRQVYVFDLDRIGWEVVRSIVGRAPALAAFNATFELKFLSMAGVEPACRVYDVMTACWLTHGCRPSLDEAAGLYFAMVLPKILGGSDWSTAVLWPEQIEYAGLDAVLTVWLWQEQRQAFDEADENAQELADGCLLATARMELAGMPIQCQRHEHLIRQWQDELRTAEDRLLTVTGGQPLNTPAQVVSWLDRVLPADLHDAWPRTDGGQLTSSAPVLKLHLDVQAVPELLEVRKMRKLLSAFGSVLLDKVHPITGRLHPSFLVAGARTGRFSSRNPNLQQMPKRQLKAFRNSFTAPPGRMLVVADYSQIELRVAAELSGDKAMLAAYQSGVDLHTQTACGVSGHDHPSEDERTLAKVLNFGLLYGAGAGTFRNFAQAGYGVVLSLEQAEAAREAFFATYAGLRTWQHQTASGGRCAGYVQTAGGRRWRWAWDAPAWFAEGDELGDYNPPDDDPVAWSSWSPRHHGDPPGFRFTFALNHPVQGSAAEVAQLALDQLDRALRRYDARITATVHDEIVVECAEDQTTVCAVLRLMRTKMTIAFLAFFPDHPWRHLVGIKVGRSWE